MSPGQVGFAQQAHPPSLPDPQLAGRRFLDSPPAGCYKPPSPPTPGGCSEVGIASRHVAALRSVSTILGIGIDVVDIDRMRRRVERDPGLLSSFLTASELERGASASAPEDAAQMFAAKEAVVKALGAQGGDGILFREIELSAGKGPQVARLSGRALEIAAERGAGRIHLSWTCKEMKAMAVAVVESDVTPKEIA